MPLKAWTRVCRILDKIRAWTAHYGSLHDEQVGIQSYTNRFRSIEEYDERLRVVGSDFRIRSYLDSRTASGTVRWADVACGLGVALHQAREAYGSRIEAFGIDIVRWDKTDLIPQDLVELQKRYSPQALGRLLNRESYEFIQGDMGQVRISVGADLITVMCSLYYHPDPLSVWRNLFNQLRPGGTLVTHMMLPKPDRRFVKNYGSFTAALKNYADAEIFFSNDGRKDVVEAVILAKRLNDRPLAVDARVEKVKPYYVSDGLHGKFRIKAVAYEPAS